jgi:phosphoribosyl-ATP pyrophosphohydrolase
MRIQRKESKVDPERAFTPLESPTIHGRDNRNKTSIPPVVGSFRHRKGGVKAPPFLTGFIPALKRRLGRSRRAEAVSSLSLAYQLTRKVSRLGFDWPDLDGVLKKLDEEMKEFREALSLQNRSRIREELGDLLFVLVNISRFLRIDPEGALRKTVEKFMRRFHYIETSLRKKGKSFHQSNLIEMDQLWEEAKKRKKNK